MLVKKCLAISSICAFIFLLQDQSFSQASELQTQETFTSSSTQISHGKVEIVFKVSDKDIRLQDGLERLSSGSIPFMDKCTEALNSIPFIAYLWKIDTDEKHFKFIVKEDKMLATIKADNHSFADKKMNEKYKNDSVIVTPNLSGDAILIVPKKIANITESIYAYFGIFLKKAPKDQIYMVWKTTGREALALLKKSTLYINTHGHGEPWLHIRLDSRPKYYNW